MDIETKYAIGDIVIINKNQQEGKIIDIASKLGENQNVYLVKIDNKERLYSEELLSLKKANRDNEKTLEQSVVEIVDNKIEEIIEYLDICPSNNPVEQFKNACKVQMYLATSEEEQVFKKMDINNLITDGIYQGIINNKSDYISTSYVFSSILKRINMDVKTVGVCDERNYFFMSNLVLINDYYYYFDVSLEKDIYLDCNEQEKYNYKLSCAGLGKERYEEYFKPICIFESGEINPIPENISNKDFEIL